jgi:hypothetical protein
MDEHEIAEMSPLERLRRLKKLTIVLALLGMVLSIGAAINFLKIETTAPTAPPAMLDQAVATLSDFQDFGQKLAPFLEDVAKQKSDSVTLSKEAMEYAYQLNILIGKTSAILEVIKRSNQPKPPTVPNSHSFYDRLSIEAFAQAVPAPAAAYSMMSSIDSLRPMIMIGVIAAISVFFFICVGLFCLTSDADKIKFADNMMRTIVGFYIGIVTGLLGLPGK